MIHNNKLYAEFVSGCTRLTNRVNLETVINTKIYMIKDIYKFSQGIFLRDKFALAPAILIILTVLFHSNFIGPSLEFSGFEEKVKITAQKEGIDLENMPDDPDNLVGSFIWKTAFKEKSFWFKYGVGMLILVLISFIIFVMWLSKIIGELMNSKKTLGFILVFISMAVLFIAEDSLFSLFLFDFFYPIPIYLALVIAIESKKKKMFPFFLSNKYSGASIFKGLRDLLLFFIISILTLSYFSIPVGLFYLVGEWVIPAFEFKMRTTYDLNLKFLFYTHDILFVLLSIWCFVKFSGVYVYSFYKIMYKSNGNIGTVYNNGM